MRRALARAEEGASAVFLYDTHAFRGEAEGWLGGENGRPASIRARLYRGPRGRLGIVPEPSAPFVRGRLIEVTPLQLPVLDFLLGGVGASLVRRPVNVVVNLHTTRAAAWVITDVRSWKPMKQDQP